MGDTHDDKGFQLAPHKVKGREDVWWYEEADGLHMILDVRACCATVPILIPWKQILAAARRGDLL